MSGCHEHHGGRGGGIKIGRSKPRHLFVVLVVIGRGVGAAAAAAVPQGQHLDATGTAAQLNIRHCCRKLDDEAKLRRGAQDERRIETDDKIKKRQKKKMMTVQWAIRRRERDGPAAGNRKDPQRCALIKWERMRIRGDLITSWTDANKIPHSTVFFFSFFFLFYFSRPALQRGWMDGGGARSYGLVLLLGF